MSLYDGLSVETAPIPEISEKVSKKEEGKKLAIADFCVPYVAYRRWLVFWI